MKFSLDFLKNLISVYNSLCDHLTKDDVCSCNFEEPLRKLGVNIVSYTPDNVKHLDHLNEEKTLELLLYLADQMTFENKSWKDFKTIFDLLVKRYSALLKSAEKRYESIANSTELKEKLKNIRGLSEGTRGNVRNIDIFQ